MVIAHAATYCVFMVHFFQFFMYNLFVSFLYDLDLYVLGDDTLIT